MKLFRTLVLLAAGAVVSPTFAQPAPQDAAGPPELPPAMTRDAEGHATVRTMRLPSPQTFDGRLDEAFYSLPAIEGFIQQEPSEGQPARERTQVWVFFDATNVYVSARLWESDKAKRVTSDMRRDAFNLYNNDHFAVGFDTFNDRRNGYFFYANAQGGITDTQLTNEQPNNNWNGLWDVRTAEFENGWTLEMRFPFRSMRFRENSQEWGINFRRVARASNEISFLNFVPASFGRRGLTLVSRYGTLTGIEAPGRLRNLDVKPYALGSLLTNLGASPPFTNRGDADAGVDVKWGITQSLVADFTVNTDFAQVEDDEAQVNLTRFSVFFPEKREFFLEGQDVFNFGGGGFGGGGGGGGGGPGGGGGGGGGGGTPQVFFSRRIGLSNGRVVPILAGARVSGRGAGFQVGGLHMRTKDAPEAAAEATDFSVLRVNRNVLRRSRIGIIATRRAPAVTGGENLAYGADAQFNFLTDLSFNAYWAKTSTDGRDGDDTSYRGRFAWNSDLYGVEAEHVFVGEDFNPEIGFLRRTAYRRSFGQARYSPRPQGWDAVRKLFFETSVDYYADAADVLESREQQAQFRMEMENGDQLNVEYTRSFERLVAAFDVAKGVTIPAGSYDFGTVRGTYTLGSQRKVSGGVTLGRGSFYDGTLTEVTWRGRVELSPQFYVEPTLSLNRVESPWGDGQNNLVSTRATYTISPRMFAAALVQYQSRSDTVSTNLRFRWEYSPGSDLFVVYSDGRTTLTRGFPSMENRSFVVKLTRLLRW